MASFTTFKKVILKEMYWEWKIAAQTIGPMMETTTICFV